MNINILEQIDEQFPFLLDEYESKVNMDNLNKFYQTFSASVNTFGYSPEKVYTEFYQLLRERNCSNSIQAQAAYAETYLQIFALQWIYFWGTLPMFTELDPEQERSWREHRLVVISVDDRNIKAVEKCRFISRLDSFKKELEFLSEKIDYSDWKHELSGSTKVFRELLLKINHMHKTNIQTATQLMIYTVARRNTKIRETLVDMWGDSFYCLPMI